MFLSISPKQIKAVKKLTSKKILFGDMGSGKSRVGLAWYYNSNGGNIEIDDIPKLDSPKDLYIITTPKKRDDLEWEEEMIPFLMSSKQENNIFKNKIVIDSWNNIKKYEDIKDAYFIFDEDRVIGNGAWVDSFLRITCERKRVPSRDPRHQYEYAYIPRNDNKWIILSATPGDIWMDYIPVFVANGFYYNRTDFIDQHVVWARYVKFPKPDRYLGLEKLNNYRNQVLLYLESDKTTIQHHEDVYCDYDFILYKNLLKERWDFYNNEPIKNGSKLCYLQRRVTNSSLDRQLKLVDIYNQTKCGKLIVFYSYDYELEILKNINYGNDVAIAEYNGHKHEDIPKTNKWVYLVQYTSGSEAWNCILTDTMVFFSQSHSYKATKQASGRIDRRNNIYKDLYYYHLKSRSPIDVDISRCLEKKKDFNKSSYIRKLNEQFFKEEEKID